LLLLDPIGTCPERKGRLQDGEASRGDAVDWRPEEKEGADDPERAEEDLGQVDDLGLVLEPLEDGLLALVRVEGVLGVKARGIAGGAQ